MSEEIPVVKGGQGRSDHEVQSNGIFFALIVIIAFHAVVAVTVFLFTTK